MQQTNFLLSHSHHTMCCWSGGSVTFTTTKAQTPPMSKACPSAAFPSAADICHHRVPPPLPRCEPKPKDQHANAVSEANITFASSPREHSGGGVGVEPAAQTRHQSSSLAPSSWGSSHFLLATGGQEGWEPPSEPQIEQHVFPSTRNANFRNICRLWQQMKPTLGPVRAAGEVGALGRVNPRSSVSVLCG